MSEEARGPEAAKFTDRLAEILSDERLGEGLGYSRDQCEAIATAMAAVEFDGDRAPDDQRLALMTAMLRAQPNIGDAEALVTASVFPRLQLGKVLISAGMAADLLGIHQTTLLRRRWEGDIHAALVDQGTYRAGVYYALADVLYVMAYQAKHPYPGGAVKTWPDLS